MPPPVVERCATCHGAPKMTLAPQSKESVQKIIVMRSNRVRKKCFYYWIAIFPITFLGICMEFLCAVFCITLSHEFFQTYVIW